MDEARKTGIDAIGDVNWGAHMCQFYQTKEDLIEVLVPYVQAGLESNEFCLWITAEPLSAEEAKRAMGEAMPDFARYLKKGQIEIIPYTEWHTRDGAFDARRVVSDWIDKLKQALAEGYEGLRVTEDLSWLQERDSIDSIDYKAGLDNAIAQLRMLSICTYSLDKCKASCVMDVACSHDLVLVRREGRWVPVESSTCEQVEGQLRCGRDSAQKYLDVAGVVLMVINADRKVGLINSKGCAILGYRAEEIIGQNWFNNFIPARVRDEVEAVFEKLMAGEIETVEYFENPVLIRNGEERIIAWHNAILRDGKGKVTAALCSGEDITVRKQAEEALQASEGRYRTLVENANEAIIVAQEGILKFANPKTAEITGYSKKELTSMPFTELIHPDDRGLVIERHLMRLKGEEFSHVYPFRVVTKDGSVRWVEINAVFITWEERPATLNFLTDITERKRMEEERKDMEQKAQLTSRLAAVGEIASGIAHEINNPLTGVIGYAQLLMREDLPEAVRKDAETINAGAQRVADIIKRLLTFARQYKPERNYAAINEIVKTTLSLRAYELENSNIEVTHRLAPQLPTTVADAGQLQQVFLNLIMNAEAEMKLAHGKGKLLVKTGKIGNTIRISFKDDGPGIARENLDRIFDPFFTTRVIGEGTGLGLSVCHGIIAAHDGRIYAESELGKGATFIVELPIVTELERREQAEPGADELQKVAKAKILVVDDDPGILQFVSRVLTDEGHEVETVDNAYDALERVGVGRYSLILVDIKMPGMTGIELQKRFQKKARSLARRVVFMTGDVAEASTKYFLFRTKAPYLIKPFDVEQLNEVIARTLTGSA